MYPASLVTGTFPNCFVGDIATCTKTISVVFNDLVGLRSSSHLTSKGVILLLISEFEEHFFQKEKRFVYSHVNCFISGLVCGNH